jgi:hypothetical protein
MDQHELDIVRRAFAKQVMAAAHRGEPRLDPGWSLAYR